MPNANDHFELGVSAFNAGDIEMAIEELESATELDDTNYRAFNYLGASYAAKKRYSTAVGAFKRAEKLHPNCASIHFNIAQAYEADDVMSEAEYEYNKALEIDPNYKRAEDALNSIKEKLHQL